MTWLAHERVSEEGGQLPVEVGDNVPPLLGQGPVVGVEGRGNVEGGRGGFGSWGEVVWFAGAVCRAGLWSCVAV